MSSGLPILFAMFVGFVYFVGTPLAWIIVAIRRRVTGRPVDDERIKVVVYIGLGVALVVSWFVSEWARTNWVSVPLLGLAILFAGVVVLTGVAVLGAQLYQVVQKIRGWFR